MNRGYRDIKNELCIKGCSGSKNNPHVLRFPEK